MDCHRRPSQQRQLDEVLQDPNASWGEIREAMKSSKGCTNAAIMGAIASGRGVAVVPDVRDKRGKPTDSNVVVDAAAAPPRASSPAGIETLCVPLGERVGEPSEQPGAQEDVTNSRNRRPSRRGMRKASSRRGLRSSARRSQRRRQMNSSLISNASDSDLEFVPISVKASVNMMDFGVSINRFDHSCLDDDDEGEGGAPKENSSVLGNGRVGRRGSASDGLGSLDGFLGWDHGDQSDSDVHSSSVSNYSNLVDSSGFLDWDRKKNAQHSDVQSSLRSSGVGSDFSYGDLVDSSGFLDWDRKNGVTKNGLASTRTRLASSVPVNSSGFSDQHLRNQHSTASDDVRSSSEKKEQWNIEDYEDPNDNSTNNRQRRKTFFVNHLKRIQSKQTTAAATAAAAKNEEIKMDDIKEALKKVSNFSGKGCAASDGEIVAAPKEDADSRRRNRRRTVAVMPGFLGGGDAAADDDSQKQNRRRTVVGMNGFFGGERTTSFGSGGSNGFFGRERATSFGSGGSQPASDGLEEKKPVRHQRIHCLTSAEHGKPENGITHIEKARHMLRLPCGRALFPPTAKGQEEESNIWNEGQQRPSRKDLRDAIWINRKDGDFDIKKECRKLYVEERQREGNEQDHQKQKRGGGRRATVLGFEMPDFSNEDWGLSDDE